jgi:outer membrane protein OmpA-like peptidoglycan-associated protein
MKAQWRGAARAASAMTVVWALMHVTEAKAADSIPLCPGLTVVTAVSQPGGDYESIKTVESISSTEVRLRYSAEMRNGDIFSSGPELKTVNFGRTMLVKDLQSATDYQQVYLEKSVEKIPGTTAIGTSTAVLQNLKSKGQSKFGFSNAYPELVLTADSSKYPNYYSYLQRGVLQRVAGPATISVIVNDVPMDLPVVHAQGTLVGDKVDFLFLDDPANPLTLVLRIGVGAIKPLTPEEVEFCAKTVKNGIVPPSALHCDKPNGGDRDTLSVVKIAFRCQVPSPAGAGGGKGIGQMPGFDAGSVSGLEKALANRQKVDVYSIYFSFNRDALRDESTATLKEIADILTRHPDWRLAVNGHTDGIGTDQYNLDLSKRRAAAVVKALVTRYHIDASRLKSAGFGKSQPKDSNDTLEGRARNRRVELMRF